MPNLAGDTASVMAIQPADMERWRRRPQQQQEQPPQLPARPQEQQGSKTMAITMAARSVVLHVVSIQPTALAVRILGR